MTAHEKRLAILLLLVLVSYAAAAFGKATSETHDVLLIALSSLTTQIATKEGEK
jgi:hypothetical protein